MTESKRRARAWLWWLSLIGGALAAVAVALMNFLAGAFACAWDTSACAESRDELGAFRGTITDSAGRPVGNAKFHFRDETLADGDKGPVFESDPDGSYCVMWPTGSSAPYAQPLDPGPRAYPTQDSPLGLGADTGGCQTSEHRGQWHRYRDLTSTWQYALLMILPASTAATFGAAGLFRTHDRRRAGQLMVAGALLLGLSIVMPFVLWSA